MMMMAAQQSARLCFVFGLMKCMSQRMSQHSLARHTATMHTCICSAPSPVTGLSILAFTDPSPPGLQPMEVAEQKALLSFKHLPLPHGDAAHFPDQLLGKRPHLLADARELEALIRQLLNLLIDTLIDTLQNQVHSVACLRMAFMPQLKVD
jgi:hypothetical protein